MMQGSESSPLCQFGICSPLQVRWLLWNVSESLLAVLDMLHVPSFNISMYLIPHGKPRGVCLAHCSCCKTSADVTHIQGRLATFHMPTLAP